MLPNPIDPATPLGLADLATLVVVMLAVANLLYYTVKTGVPPMPTRPVVRDAMFRLIPEDLAPNRIYDLGCGWGTLIFPLAKKFPDAKVIGIEVSPLPYLFCQIRRLAQPRSNLEIRYGDFNQKDLSDADLVVCYLMVRPMNPLSDKLGRDLKDDTIVISNSFALREWEAEEIEIVPESLSVWVYRYRVGNTDI
ncbi:MAG: class I SAM-dependent methyltransferase [Rhodospirillaceae bacterium]|nr:class I SAM-dependent methyltransferase [Rhodospirillaceae bacterium]